jgi:xylan 1,4-beta-xylosidase
LKEFKNPVIRGFHPDPSLCRVDQDYYLACSSFEYFPGIPIFRSRDLVSWTLIGHVFTDAEELNLSTCGDSFGLWAPCIRYHQGKFYLIVTKKNQGKADEQLLVQTENPAGPWSPAIRIPLPGIDPSLFFDPSGDCIFNFRVVNKGIRQAKIDTATGEFLETLYEPWSGMAERIPEGPHTYWIDGYFFLLLAQGGTEFGHMVTVARSRSLRGPYEPCPWNPILTHRHRHPHPIQGTGHGDLVQDPNGNWWMVFLAFRTVSVPFCTWHQLGRETFLAPVTWQDGWPVVNGGLPIEEIMSGPLPDTSDSTTALAYPSKLDWTYLRRPCPGIQFDSEGCPTHLPCSGSIDNPDDLAWVGVRQRDFHASFSVDVSLSGDDDSCRAGIIVWANREHYYAILLRPTSGGVKIELDLRIGPIRETRFINGQTVRKPVKLEVRATQEDYRLGSYILDGSDWRCSEALSSRYLSSEIAGGFTGVFIALIAEGPLECETIAGFSNIEYHPCK